MKEDLRQLINEKRIYLDGGFGTMLQNEGIETGEKSENWNITHPDKVIEIHKKYIAAGANIINTNTFGANLLKFNENDLVEVIRCAVENARKACEQCQKKDETYIALDVGPTGKLLKPLGELDFEDAVSIFKRTIEIGVKFGVDLINIETMTDAYEAKAAIIAAKETTDLPVFVCNAYNEKGMTMSGNTIESNVAMYEGLGVDGVGLNCSLGPDQMLENADRLVSCCSLPIIIKPNAGLPDCVDGKTVYSMNDDEFADYMVKIAETGATILGGCCGTTSSFIEKLVEKTKNIPFKKPKQKLLSVVSSRSKTVVFGGSPKIIGERINPTGKKKMKESLKNNDLDYILDLAFEQQESGADVLDVNVGMPGIDEEQMLKDVTENIQGVIDIPLQLDSSNEKALETAMRVYNGKPMVNSVNGKKDVMDKVFPLVKKYGGFVVALTLDENGIPDSVEGRVEIARKILAEAKKYGLCEKDIIFDTLTMTVSTDKFAARKTIDALKAIRYSLKCNTCLGVSNVSFGLPSRQKVNAAFFTLAMENGLSAGIVNPKSDEMMNALYCFNALNGYDENLENYIGYATENEQEIQKETTEEKSTEEKLKEAIIKGKKEQTKHLVEMMLDEMNPTDLINEVMIPALTEVGTLFEQNKIFLPSLLISAEASSAGFDVIKEKISSSGEKQKKRGTVVLATVKGDIHDIGKNIVKTVMENFGFEIIDLGKDVDPETVLDATIKSNSKLVGLSALMTTTVPNMQLTVELIKTKTDARVMVGGAVLTEETAREIGADFYAEDAISSVHIAQEIYG